MVKYGMGKSHELLKEDSQEEKEKPGGEWKEDKKAASYLIS